LAVEPVLRDPTEAYAREYAAQLRVQGLSRKISGLKSKLQRTNPLDDQQAYNRMFATLVNLEKERKELLALATGPAL
ncbi:MAG: DNA primase, partial [Actinobacteria bacterium]|nr:DNA primase [Actinomycetota bacterium]